jgi:deoxyadenosine/deoxycytidine kinase
MRLFEAFAANPSRYCEAVQEALMRARHDQYQLRSDKLKVVFDRSVDEDISVFCRIHRASGYLDASSFSRLEALAAELEADLPSPDLIIYLSANETVLRQRMDVVGHPKLIVDSLAEQVRLYDEWISCRSESVVKIDNSNCPPAMLDAIVKGWLC